MRKLFDKPKKPALYRVCGHFQEINILPDEKVAKYFNSRVLVAAKCFHAKCMISRGR